MFIKRVFYPDHYICTYFQKMEKVINRQECKKLLDSVRKQNYSIGFVPTMGALHEGHLELISKSLKNSDFTISSIFVNPTQFNNRSDYENYPRNINDDLKKLEDIHCHCVFVPKKEQIYSGNGRSSYDLGNLDRNMEGAHRPGHFQGVAMVVDRLFEIIQPDMAFFGEKDFQQLQIIKHLVKTLGYDIQIVSCPIIREDDGLAMSSRNQRLSEKQRQVAPVIYESLKLAHQLAGKKTVDDVKQMVKNKVNQTQLLHVEYFEIVDENSLEEITTWKSSIKIRACIAVNTGDIRLIDNVKISS